MYDVIIIGAGQAGLAAAYYLKQAGIDFIVLDSAHAVGDSWRNRYDSLQLFTPRQYNGLPGMLFEGDQNGLPSKDEVALYLSTYVAQMKLPVKMSCGVNRLWKDGQVYKADTSKGIIQARNVIVATGPFQVKSVPSFSKAISENIYQLHSSEYRNPEQLKQGSVLVVGGGNSGAQIAVELANKRNRDVYLSVARPLSFKPQYILHKSIFWYFEKIGFLRAGSRTLQGKWLRNQPEQIYGLELKRLIQGDAVKLISRVIDAKHADVSVEDGSQVNVQNIIWATGFKRDDSWIDIPEAFGDAGQVMHEGGVSPIPGLCYVGLPWQTSRGSALLGWVKYDAERIVEYLIRNAPAN